MYRLQLGATIFSIFFLITTQAEARSLVSCPDQFMEIGFGIEVQRLFEGNGFQLNGPSFKAEAEASYWCLVIGLDARFAFKRNDEATDFGDSLDPIIGFKLLLFDLLVWDASFKYLNYGELGSNDPNGRLVGDVMRFGSGFSLPWSIDRKAKHTLTPRFAMRYYEPTGWDPLLSAEGNYQVRGSLSYNWRPDKDLDIFVSAGAVWDPNRTLIFEDGLAGRFRLGARVQVHKYMAISMSGNLWIQNKARLYGPEPATISTPAGPIVVDLRERQDKYSGSATLLFHIPFDL